MTLVQMLEREESVRRTKFNEGTMLEIDERGDEKEKEKARNK